MSSSGLGKLGEAIAHKLWPDLQPTKSGSHEDLRGTDAIAESGPVQIKTDRRIATSKNLFWEIEKRRDGKWNDHGISSDWYPSLSSTTKEYIFVTHELAYRVPVSELKRAVETNKIFCEQINETAKGYLIPIVCLDSGKYEVKVHNTALPTPQYKL